EVSYIEIEVGILKDLRHPNITQLLEVIEDQDKVHLVLEYVKGVDLRQELRRSHKNRLQEKDAQRIFRDLLEAVGHCPDRGIVRRDCKPENVLMDIQGRAKVCDFGVGIRFRPGQEVTVVRGTLAYCAPEIFSRQRYQGPPLDIWALGVILFEMLTGDNPFDG
ncbi:sperm motility kinase 2A-like, partial [Fukomys damarensis]|uniref:sperm motility kinase 2A-like n=1 Tax=Fukomys damarensis TaxID=885580 RepID=UPI0014550FCB